MANEIEKVNTIAIADIEKFNGKTDDNIEKLNTLEFAGLASTFYGSRAFFHVPTGGNQTNILSYKTVGSSSDSLDFGDLQTSRRNTAGAGSNITRGIFSGGYGLADSTTIWGITDTDYITVGTLGNGTDFGDLTAETGAGTQGGCSNGTLLFTCGGFGVVSGANTYHDKMEYFTIASTGNGTDAGNLVDGRSNLGIGSDGLSRYIVAGGKNSSWASHDVIQYNDFSTSANTSDFGDLSDVAFEGNGAVENLTRVVIGLGRVTASETRVDTLEYITVASTGDSQDFGDLSLARGEAGGVSDGTNGDFIGGERHTTAARLGIIDTITIASTGNASDVADILEGSVLASRCAPLSGT